MNLVHRVEWRGECLHLELTPRPRVDGFGIGLVALATLVALSIAASIPWVGSAWAFRTYEDSKLVVARLEDPVDLHLSAQIREQLEQAARSGDANPLWADRLDSEQRACLVGIAGMTHLRLRQCALQFQDLPPVPGPEVSILPDWWMPMPETELLEPEDDGGLCCCVGSYDEPVLPEAFISTPRALLALFVMVGTAGVLAVRRYRASQPVTGVVRPGHWVMDGRSLGPVRTVELAGGRLVVRPVRGRVWRSRPLEPLPRTLLDDLQRALTPPEAEAEERLAREALARFLS